jgi:pimeloyl-ACP methyl ester carboxylesterase
MAEVRLPGGPTLSYQEWGRPDGAVVLMLHGLTSTGSTWRHVASALGEDFRVIAPDARGHGGSEWTRDYSVDAMVEDVVGFCEQVGILGAIVVGHSMGAVTAYALAARRPDLIRQLVLEEMPPPDPADPPRPLPHQHEPGDTTDWRAVVAFRRWRNAPPRDWWDLADRITAETLVISGSQSHLPAKRVEELSHRLPKGRFASLDLGHVPHEERPSEFLRVVQPFVAYFAK